MRQNNVPSSTDARNLDYKGWINADGSVNSSNIVSQINSINEKVTALTTEMAGKQANVDRISAMEAKTGYDCPTKNQHSWIDGAGVKWCGKDSHSGWQSAIAWKNEEMARVSAIKNVLLPGLKKQLDDLNASIPALAKSDPAVIAANAAAEKSIAKSKNISTVYWIVGGVVLTLIATWAIIKIVRAAKK